MLVTLESHGYQSSPKRPFCCNFHTHWGSIPKELEGANKVWTVESKIFFDQVGHETMFSSSGNKHFFTKSCHRQTYQNYEQSQQKLGTILENKVS